MLATNFIVRVLEKRRKCDHKLWSL